MSRLRVNTTVTHDYRWDGKPLDTLSREELLEAVKVLAAESQSRLMQEYRGPAVAGLAKPLLVVDAFAGQRQGQYAQSVGLCQQSP